jgi:hypothetical protein
LAPRLLGVLAAIALTACGSGTLSERQETYSGPPAAAVAPVTEGRTVPLPQVSRWWIQKVIADELARAEVFAGVVRLEHPRAENEAGVVILPTLMELRWRDPSERGGDVTLRVRVLDKATGRVEFERVYKGGCGRCAVPLGQPSIVGPVSALMEDLSRDLRKRFG